MHDAVYFNMFQIFWSLSNGTVTVDAIVHWLIGSFIGQGDTCPL